MLQTTAGHTLKCYVSLRVFYISYVYAFSINGFSLNLKLGTSEATIIFRGPGSKQVKLKLARENVSSCPLECLTDLVLPSA